MLLTQEEAKEILNYNPESGLFLWKVRKQGRKVGVPAGTKDNEGYVKIFINRKSYGASRLAFLITEGYMPEHMVDHINGKTDDNRWVNLRHVTNLCNLQNRKVQCNNTTGFPGVSRTGKRFNATVRLNNKNISLGVHDTVLEAALTKYTFEESCYKFNCNARNNLAKAIKNIWPEFKPTMVIADGL